MIKAELKKIDEEIEEKRNKIKRLEYFLSRGTKVMQGVNIKDELNKLKEEVKPLSQKKEELQNQLEFKEAENIAFKCNWNDRGYKGICSKKAYEFNQEAKHVWCIQEDNPCHELIKKNKNGFPCYESHLLIDFCFEAGANHSGQRAGKSMSINTDRIREGKVAFLTTREPGMKEEDRYIFGVLDINKIENKKDKNEQEDPTRIFGDEKTSIVINEKVKLNFWDFHKNNTSNICYEKFWAEKLHRFISDEEALKILSALRDEYKKLNLDIEEIRKINNLIDRFENSIDNVVIE